MSAGWFDPILGSWFDETDQEAGWFSADSADDLSGGGGGGTITHVQSAHGEAGSGTSPTATFSSNVTAGNLLTIVASAYRAGTPPHAFIAGDLTKSSGTATIGTVALDLQHARANGSSSEIRVALYSVEVTGSGSLTLSLAVNTGDYANIAAAEFSGADTSSGRLDTSTSNDAAGPGSGANLQIGDMTSAGAGLFVGGFGAYTSATSTWTPDGAFSTIYNVGDVAYNASAAIYRIVSSATTDSADCQISAFDTPGWVGASAVYKAASGGGPIEEPVGLATESDTASALAAKKIRATGFATEAETASSLARVKRRAVGLATTTETASALPRVKSRPVGLATEADTAYALARGGHTIATGLAAETDAAYALGRLKARAVSLASETSAAFALGRVKSRPVGLAVETDQAFALAGGGPVETLTPEWIMRHRRRGRR